MKIIRKILNRFIPEESIVVSHYSQLGYEERKRLIKSMAVKWSEVKQDIVHHLPVMLEHLVKIYYYHDFTEYLRGWIDSVRKGFDDVPLIKGKNKLPTEKQIFDLIWDERLSGNPNRSLLNHAIEINNEYDEVPKIPINNLDYEGFRKFLYEFLKLLSKSVSQRGTISTPEIRDFVENWNYKFSLKD